MKSLTLARRRALVTTAALGLLAALPAAAWAQAYPSKPLTMVVPFSAGGTTDILARIVGKAMEAELGQPIVIDNKAGAGGNIGAQAAARAKADGYTLFMGTVGTHAINEALSQNAITVEGKPRVLDYERAEKLLTDSANRALGKPVVISAQIVSALPL